MHSEKREGPEILIPTFGVLVKPVHNHARHLGQRDIIRRT